MISLQQSMPEPLVGTENDSILAASDRRVELGRETGQGCASVSILSMQSSSLPKIASQAFSLLPEAFDGCQSRSPPRGDKSRGKKALKA